MTRCPSALALVALGHAVYCEHLGTSKVSLAAWNALYSQGAASPSPSSHILALPSWFCPIPPSFPVPSLTPCTLAVSLSCPGSLASDHFCLFLARLLARVVFLSEALSSVEGCLLAVLQGPRLPGSELTSGPLVAPG